MVTAVANLTLSRSLVDNSTHTYRNSKDAHVSISRTRYIPMEVGLWPLQNLSNKTLNQVFDVDFHSSAQNPEPMCGVSPILPTSLLVRPPVEVKTAIQPRISKATAPIVPLGN